MSENILNELYIDLSKRYYNEEGKHNISCNYFNISYEYIIFENSYNSIIESYYNYFNLYLNVKVNHLIIKKIPKKCINLYCNNNVLKSIDLTKYNNIKLYEHNNIEIISDKIREEIRKEKEKIKLENERKENIVNDTLDKINNLNDSLYKSLKDFNIIKININDLTKYYNECKKELNELQNKYKLLEEENNYLKNTDKFIEENNKLKNEIKLKDDKIKELEDKNIQIQLILNNNQK